MGWQPRRNPEDVGSAIPNLDDLADDDVVALARRDHALFAVLYRRYAVAVYRYCDRALSDEGAAEEMTQTVFLRALSALPTYRGGSFRSWLFAIAHNAILDARRARRPLTSLDNAMALPDRAASTEEQVLDAMAGQEITRLLAHLPREQRAVVELRLAGLRDREIAEILGRSPGAIRTAQYRAVQHLRQLLCGADEREVASAVH